MEAETMGRVVAEVTFENVRDLWAAEQGLIPGDQIRRIVVKDALVDTGATYLSMPTRMICQLGLSKGDTRRIRTCAGLVDASLYGPVQFTIQDRTGKLEVMEMADDVPVLIGQIPLELLDFVVDPQSCSLTGNPAHGGKWMAELY